MYWRDRLSPSPSSSSDSQDVDVVACSPGFVPSTSLFTRSRPFPLRWGWSLLAPLLIPSAVPLDQGAGRLLTALTLPSEKLREEGASGYLVKGTQWGSVEERCLDRQMWDLVVEQQEGVQRSFPRSDGG